MSGNLVQNIRTKKEEEKAATQNKYQLSSTMEASESQVVSG